MMKKNAPATAATRSTADGDAPGEPWSATSWGDWARSLRTGGGAGAMVVLMTRVGSCASSNSSNTAEMLSRPPDALAALIRLVTASSSEPAAPASSRQVVRVEFVGQIRRCRAVFGHPPGRAAS